MKVIFAIFVAIVGIFANVSADGKEDGNLLKVLAAERKETSEMFKRENQRLRQEDDQLHGKLDKLNVKLDKLQGQNKKLQKKNKKLEEEIIKLRGTDSEIKASIRQKDQLQNGTRSALDLDDHFKKLIKSGIIDFLTNERICVSGKFSGRDGSHNIVKTTHDVDFGYTFPRKPAVSVAISWYQDAYTGSYYTAVEATVTEVTNSSAEISVTKKDINWRINWTACL